LGLADADDKAGERACGVELRHGPVEGAECRDVEALEDLAVRSQASRGRRLRTRRGRPRTELRLKTRRRQTSGCKVTSRGGDVDETSANGRSLEGVSAGDSRTLESCGGGGGLNSRREGEDEGWKRFEEVRTRSLF
jgi:hypothetical protein